MPHSSPPRLRTGRIVAVQTCTGKGPDKCPLWVISRHLQCKRRCPLCAKSGHGDALLCKAVKGKRQKIYGSRLAALQSASRITACMSTAAPASRCSGRVSSRTLWLRPPTLGTNIIPDGQIRAIICASWPAPDGRRREGRARSRAVVSTSETISAGNATGSKRARLRVEIDTPHRGRAEQASR